MRRRKKEEIRVAHQKRVQEKKKRSGRKYWKIIDEWTKESSSMAESTDTEIEEEEKLSSSRILRTPKRGKGKSKTLKELLGEFRKFRKRTLKKIKRK